MEGWFGKPDAKFVFQCKLYTDSIISSKDPKIINLLFIQAVYSVITGAYPTTEKDAVQLAAWQFQAKFGSHNPATHKTGFLTNSIVEYVPGPHMAKTRSPAAAAAVWEPLIFHKHAFSTTQVPRETYLQVLSKRDYYGAVLFAVKQRYDRSLPRKLFLGISRRGIVLLRVPTRPPEEDMETLARFALADIYRWAYKPGVNFYFEIKADDGGGFGSLGGDAGNPVYTFDTAEGKHMSDMLTDYAMALLREMGLNPDGSKRERPRDRAAAAAAEAMAAQAAAAAAAAAAATVSAPPPPPPPPPVAAPVLPPPLPTRGAMATTADAYRHVGGDVGALASAALRSGEADPYAQQQQPAPEAYLPPPLPSVAPPVAPPAPAGEKTLPPNWIKCYDEASADYYFFNTISGESVWEEAGAML